MKKMTFIQKFKLILQNMRMRWEIIFIYLFIALFAFVLGIEFKLFSANFFTYIIIAVATFLLHFLVHIIEVLGILLKRVYLMDGTICNSYNDYAHREDHGGTGRTGFYEKKYISLFSDKVKARNVPVQGFVRIKVKSSDEKYISPWISVTKRVFKNIKSYDFKVVVYKNIPVTAYYEKK